MIWFRIPMLALLFIGTRQRASRIDPKHGKSQRWAKTCFYSCTVSVCVQTILDHNALLFLLFAFSPQLVRLRPAAFSPPRLLASAGAPVTRRRFAFSPSRLLAFSPPRLLASSPQLVRLSPVAVSPSRLLSATPWTRVSERVRKGPTCTGRRMGGSPSPQDRGPGFRM